MPDMVKTHVCPTDGRAFATAKALAQHTATHKVAAQLPQARRKAPRRPNKGGKGVVPRTIRGGGNLFRPVITTGTDLLIQATVSSSRAAGSLIFQRALIPTKMQNTRISAEGTIWQRWRPKRLMVKTVGSGPTTAGGSYVLAWSPDPHVNKEGQADFIAMAISAEKNQVVRFDQSATFTIPCDTTQKWYNVDGTVETSSHGTLFAVLITPPIGVRGSITMPCMLDWEIQWEGRKLDVGLHSSTVIKPDDGYENIFTTSDSGYDSGILTFKMHAGGSMVPFSSSIPGAIYEVGKGTQVPYYDANGKVAHCQYFSRVISYEVPGLVLHTNLTDAQEYQRTGNKSYCIPYKSAGPYVSPVHPEFKTVTVSRTVTEERVDTIESLRKEIENLKLLMFSGSMHPTQASGGPSIEAVPEDEDFEFLGRGPTI